jgi:hypothetical protein
VPEGADLAAHLARGRSVAADGAADEPEREVLLAEVGEAAHHANAVDLRGPLCFVSDLDQADVEIDVDVLPRPFGVHLLKGEPRELLV